MLCKAQGTSAAAAGAGPSAAPPVAAVNASTPPVDPFHAVVPSSWRAIAEQGERIDGWAARLKHELPSMRSKHITGKLKPLLEDELQELTVSHPSIVTRLIGFIIIAVLTCPTAWLLETVTTTVDQEGGCYYCGIVWSPHLSVSGIGRP